MRIIEKGRNLASTILVNRAHVEMGDKNYHRAIRVCNIALRIDPRNAEAYYVREYCSSYQKKISTAAIENYSKAISLNPMIRAYVMRGVCPSTPPSI